MNTCCVYFVHCLKKKLFAHCVMLCGFQAARMLTNICICNTCQRLDNVTITCAWVWYCVRCWSERAIEDDWVTSRSICSEYPATDCRTVWPADAYDCRAGWLGTRRWPGVGTCMWYESGWSVFFPPFFAFTNYIPLDVFAEKVRRRCNRYGHIAGNTVEENSSVNSLIRMC